MRIEDYRQTSLATRHLTNQRFGRKCDNAGQYIRDFFQNFLVVEEWHISLSFLCILVDGYF